MTTQIPHFIDGRRSNLGSTRTADVMNPSTGEVQSQVLMASAADVDTAMTLGANYPQGPLAFADEIGLGEILAVLEALHAEYGDDRYRPAPLLRRLVLAGCTGKAAGRGFHRYP